MRRVLISGAIGFLITAGAFAVIADNSFWTPSVSVPDKEKTETISITNEPSVQASFPTTDKEKKDTHRNPQSESDLTVKLRSKQGGHVVAKNEIEKPEGITAGAVSKVLPYTVQIASFKTSDEAEARLMNIKAAGFEGFVQNKIVNGIQYYRVRLGPVSSNDEAKQLKESFAKKTGIFDTFITKARD